MPERWRRAPHPTPHLFVGGRLEQLERLCEKHTVQCIDGRLYATFLDGVEAAERAAEALRAAGVFAGFSEPAPVPAATSEQAAVLEVPPLLQAAGLRLHREVVTAEEEARLLAEVDAREWDTAIHRRVQHYGERFDYATKTVGANRPPPLPEWVAPVLQMVKRARAVPWADEAAADGRVQLTVNEYLPGVGIASHIDTHSAFEDGIAALSLGCGIGMKLQPAAPTTATAATAAAAAAAAEPLVLWLPPRSLLVFSGEARYAWRHGIATKKGDVVHGAWMSRGRRVSLTLRRVRANGKCRCGWPDLCDSQGAVLQLPSRIGAGPRGGANTGATSAPENAERRSNVSGIESRGGGEAETRSELG